MKVFNCPYKHAKNKMKVLQGFEAFCAAYGSDDRYGDGSA